MSQYKPLPTVLAFLFLIFLLVSLGVRFWAGEQGARFTGPTHIAAGKEQVWVFAAGDLYRLSTDGELSGVYGAQTTGLNSVPIDLGIVPDGRLLVAEQQPARIRVCDTDSWQCETILSGSVAAIKRQFKVLSGKLPGEWLLTDAVGGTLWGIRTPDREPIKLVPDGTLAGPNGLVMDHNDNLWVADTDHRRIIELLPAGDGSYLPGREHSAVNEFTVGERYYPMMLAQTPAGKLWATQAAEFSKPWSDLVVYDPDNGAEAIVELPEGAYATDVAAMGAQLLVTDMERFEVYRADPETMSAENFGDGAFRQKMVQIQDSRAEYDRMESLSLFLLLASAALMIVFAVQATPKEKRWTAPPGVFDPEKTSGEIPHTSTVHWLERNPRAEMIFRWGERVFYGALITLVVCVLVFYGWLYSEAGQAMQEEQMAKTIKLGFALLLGALMVASMIPVVRITGRAMSRKLGTDGRHIYIRLEDGRELVVDPPEIAYTHRMIHYRNYTVPLQGGGHKPMYLPGEMDKWLAPMLRKARKISPLQAMKHQWVYRDGLLIWSLITTAAAGLILMILMMAR